MSKVKDFIFSCSKCKFLNVKEGEYHQALNKNNDIPGTWINQVGMNSGSFPMASQSITVATGNTADKDAEVAH